MQNLRVTDFSCIQSANIDVARLTILIGPQASGKSVLSKLIYFFNDLLDRQWGLIEEGVDAAGFKTFIGEQFSIWFPPSAWGPKKFSILWEAGNISIKIIRSTYNKKISDTLRITISESLTSFYTQSLKGMEKFLRAKTSRAHKDRIELAFRLRRTRRQTLASTIEDGSYFSNSYFIPAGRAFFTSLGKVFTAFEGNNMLDPVTTAFGRLYATYRDPRLLFWEGDERHPWAKELYELLGGTPVRKGDQDLVELKDGRLVPFSALSSGQQELLPLITMLEIILDQRFQEPNSSGDLVFIEEPEAHLFPKSQSRVVELLVEMTHRPKRPPTLFLTTHSPYVLSKINTLIKAGVLSEENPKKNNSIAKIIPPGLWLRSGEVNAYAIEDGKVSSIIDDDKFIDSDYLDEISNEISNEYSALLEIEFNDE